MSALLVLATHAIQYQAPLFRCLRQEFGVDLQVVFLQEPALNQPYWDREFGRYVQWDIPLVDGYAWSVLPSGGPIRRLMALQRKHRDHGRSPILLTGWGTPLHWLVWTWAILNRTPVLQLAETNRASYALHSRSLLRHLWLRFLICHTDALLYIGQRNREFYEWMGASASRLFSCPYSIDNERFSLTYERQRPERDARLEQLGLDPALPVLLFCGKLIRKKRPDLLLEAASAIESSHGVNVLLVGDGEQRLALQEQALELGLKRTAFLGFLNQSQMPLAYVLGDILCLLSDTPAETWGLVVNEALACGRPVFVSERCGCVPDLVAGKGTGWTVVPGDLTSTTQALSAALDCAALWPAMGERGRSVVADHSLGGMSQGIVTALHNL